MIIKTHNLVFKYDNQAELMKFNLSANHGEKIAIIGASGSGKSTLLNLISGFIHPYQGEIWICNKNYTNTEPHNRPISMLFQSNNLFNHLNIKDNISLGISPNLKLKQEEKKQVVEIAKKVGLQKYLLRMPDTLSGGQQQRAALARCLIRDKPILLLDEPFSALDKNLRIDMINLINKLSDEKSLTILIVTHQVNELSKFIDRTYKITK